MPLPMSVEEQVKIASSVSLSMANKSGVSYEDLFSEALAKLPIIEKNYIAKISNSFRAYLKSSLRGYLKNYIRDNSFEVKLPRRTLDMYMKTRKYSSYLIASLHTRWSEDEIREAHEQVKKYRSYNANQVQSWSTDAELKTSKNWFNEAVQVCDEAGIDKELLFDYYLDDLDPKEMRNKHGKGYLAKVGKQTASLKLIATSQGYGKDN